jgi:gamma-glutamylcyclotransferase (GGCT)/AIG2-like uncharacterized protein YtfP
MMNYLFVYGTLRRQSAHPMAKYLAERAEYVGEGTTIGLLYDLGRFPGMIEVSRPHAPREESLTRSVRSTIVGDIYLLRDTGITLQELDRYENAESPLPFFFERGQTNVNLADSRIFPAHIYWYRGEVKESQRIASGDYFKKG